MEQARETSPTQPLSPEALPPSDADLIAAGRTGDATAYDTLYRRHATAARSVARQLMRGQAEADDVVAETFAKILDLLRRGGGPEGAFRPYLLTAVRRAAYDRHRAERRQVVTDEMEAFDPGVPFADPAVADLERTMIARAFASLPERWQAVLWHTEIEGARPAEVATLLGLTANGVAALAYRAREGLRQAYLQMHLSGAARDGCRPVASKLGAYVRGGLARRDSVAVAGHLDQCVDCRRIFAELDDVNVALKAIVAPVVLGPAAAAYLASAWRPRVGGRLGLGPDGRGGPARGPGAAGSGRGRVRGHRRADRGRPGDRRASPVGTRAGRGAPPLALGYRAFPRGHGKLGARTAASRAHRGPGGQDPRRRDRGTATGHLGPAADAQPAGPGVTRDLGRRPRGERRRAAAAGFPAATPGAGIRFVGQRRDRAATTPVTTVAPVASVTPGRAGPAASRHRRARPESPARGGTRPGPGRNQPPGTHPDRAGGRRPGERQRLAARRDQPRDRRRPGRPGHDEHGQLDIIRMRRRRREGQYPLHPVSTALHEAPVTGEQDVT